MIILASRIIKTPLSSKIRALANQISFKKILSFINKNRRTLRFQLIAWGPTCSLSARENDTWLSNIVWLKNINLIIKNWKDSCKWVTMTVKRSTRILLCIMSHDGHICHIRLMIIFRSSSFTTIIIWNKTLKDQSTFDCTRLKRSNFKKCLKRFFSASAVIFVLCLNFRESRFLCGENNLRGDRYHN